MATVAVTGTVLLARWWATSRPRRQAPCQCCIEGRAATLDPAGSRAVHEAEEHLKQWWTRLQSLYPACEGEGLEQ